LIPQWILKDFKKEDIMKTYIISRGKGKTTKLIAESAKTGDYIICHCSFEAKRIQKEAQDMGLKIPLPITYNDFLEKRYYGKGISGFLIDNADMFLQSLTTVQINSITVSH
jgi:hydrogenase maturation factor